MTVAGDARRSVELPPAAKATEAAKPGALIAAMRASEVRSVLGSSATCASLPSTVMEWICAGERVGRVERMAC